jgi:signal transduction histidine kinase
VADVDRVFPGDSEMARRMRQFDWAATPLGGVDSWTPTLRVALGICLTSRFPIHVWWGPSLTLFYNDAYISFLGPTKHPVMLGRSGREAWTEIWDQIAPMIDRVWAAREASWSEDMLMFFARELPREEVYLTFSFSPVLGPTGIVEGMFCACTETTEKIVGNRRTETLRRLGIRAVETRTVDEACRAGIEVLDENRQDVPAAAIYLRPDWGPPEADPHAHPGEGSPQDMRLVGATAAGVPGDGDPRRVIVPIPGGGPDRPNAGLLVVSHSATRPFDAGYRAFLSMVAGHIGTAITDAQASEDERRRVEALAGLDRAKTKFFSSVSHEFRTPLTLIVGPLEDAIDRHPEARDLLTLAHRNSLRLLKLVNTLLDFSRIEEGREHASYEPTDLAAFTAELASVFRSAIEGAGLRLVVDCPPLPRPIHVDRDHWEKIVLNLLSNAFKFTFEGEIAVRLHESDGAAVLTVTDTGVGIPASELPRIFDRFHRLERTRSRTYEGSGIGLSLVRELVQMHGGSIDAASGEAGTTFTVQIPAGTAHLPAGQLAAPSNPHAAVHHARPFIQDAELWVTSSAADSPPADSHEAHILLADDNADMRDYVRRLLSVQYSVATVADGQAALEHAAASLPDLIVADVMMPRLDGFGLVRALRADPRTRLVPVILLTARTGAEARLEGLRHGADDYLTKPFSASELLARVQTHLALQGLRCDASAAVRASHAELERANQRLAHAQDVERERLARELHDALGQQITALRMTLDLIASMSSAAPGALHELVERSCTLADRLDSDLEAIAWDMRPAPIAALGLESAIRGYVADWSRQFGIDADVAIGGLENVVLQRDAELHLYRLLQEALRNVHKHAAATHVNVVLQRVTGDLRLLVEDDGRGFDVLRTLTVSPVRGAGLLNMHDRVRQIGGALDIESSQDAGTTVFIRIPLP